MTRDAAPARCLRVPPMPCPDPWCREKGECIEQRRSAAFVVAVNGQPATIIANPDTPLSEVLPGAISETGNERWGGVEKWEVVTTRGQLLDGAVTLGELIPNERGVYAFVQLKPGVAA